MNVLIKLETLFPQPQVTKTSKEVHAIGQERFPCLLIWKILEGSNDASSAWHAAHRIREQKITYYETKLDLILASQENT